MMINFLFFGICLCPIVVARASTGWLSPQYNYFFQFPLPIPEEIKPLRSVIFLNKRINQDLGALASDRPAERV